MISLLSTLLAVAIAATGSDQPQVRFDSQMMDNHADLDAWAQGEARSPSATSATHRTRRPRTIIAYVPACSENGPIGPSSQSVLCSTAAEFCASTKGAMAYWVYTAPAGTSNWIATGQTVCRGGAAGTGPATPGVTVSAEDFRRLPLPAATIMVQPQDRRTLVNIPTNLYADARPVILPTRVLGQAVRVRATPLHFRWAYGDGSTRTTADPGGPYPVLRTAHIYLEPGVRRLTLSTTYSGEFSVAGGPWLPIAGTATVQSPDTALTVLTATTHLIAGVDSGRDR
jgi:hypothetical protein